MQGIPRRSVARLIDELIERFGLTEARKADSRTLSRGMQQKLAVACAFVQQTPILLLDEPTLGLDVETSLELRGMLRSMAADAGRTILLSSHDMDVVQDVCERVIIINNGRIVTSDRISNLLELFRVRAYRFTVQGRFEDAVLHESFEGIQIIPDGHATTIDVELLDGGRFYDIVDALRRNGAVIESVDRKDPDLDEVFLRIVRGEVR
jgi:ABC-2 type transport system ATP-binding protein